ncbi:MAG: SDR family NAD(P)-dependent oxidoreductase [Thermoanaerobaculia bacterium]|nr:SDR family NAD(P)-dependent oxidoreductase [Thermoanaerobaculia bacterium]
MNRSVSTMPRALITGASGGIGGAIACQLAVVGYEVWLNGRDEERLKALATAIRSSGCQARLAPGDLTQPAELTTVVEALGDGPLDLVVHSLGAFHLASVADTPLDVLDRQLAVNLRAPWELTRQLDPRGRATRDIVFVSTTAVLAPKAGTGAYTAAKAALGALAETLRDELADAGIRVLTLYPGRTASAMQREVCRAEGQEYHPEEVMRPDDVAAMVVAAVSLPRSAEVTEIVMRHRRPGTPR